jgi:hypothetical protein
MTDPILDTISDSIQEIEDQLLAEFDKIRNSESTEPYGTIDRGVRNALDELVGQLWHDLEHSGDVNNLSLRTERHEEMSVRLIVLKKLLDAKIPTALLHENHQTAAKAKTAVRRQSSRSTTADAAPESATSDSEQKGLLGSIKSIFSGKKEDRPASRSRSSSSQSGTDSSTARVSIYLEKGVYATAKQLASLAEHFDSGGDDKELMEAAVSGKASFASRELSTAALSAREVKEKPKPTAATGAPSKFESRELSQQPPESRQDVAQTPDAIRKKLQQLEQTTTGASRFEAREVKSAVAQPSPQKPQGPVAQTPEEIRKKLEQSSAKPAGASMFESRELSNTEMPPEASDPPRKPSQPRAQTPEEIRRKLEKQQPEKSGGKAAFASKDIEPIAPREVPVKKPEKQTPPPGGKAVFESKDLSDDPPDRGR